LPGTSGKGAVKSENGAGRRGLGPSADAPSGYAEGRQTSSPAGAVVVDPLPLFRAGAVAALRAGGVPVLGEAAQLGPGIELARSTRAQVLLVGGATVAETRHAVSSLPQCSVVVLMSQPSREELVEILGTGVAGFALRSLTSEELVATVETAAAKTGHESRSSEPVFMPVLVGAPPSPVAEAVVVGEPVLTPKEREILAQLARGASNKRIAEALYVTPATVKTHLAHIYAKLGARGRHEAVSQALAMGIVQ
jgi:DNA-binding NarL/FixJ family response regulator